MSFKEFKEDFLDSWLPFVIICLVILCLVTLNNFISGLISQRQPLRHYNYIRNELKKLDEGKEIYLSDAYLQGQLLLNFRLKKHKNDEELFILSQKLALIIDKYLLTEGAYSSSFRDVSVIIYEGIFQQNTLISFNRVNSRDENNIANWYIKNIKFPAFTEDN